jgi:hypothetical protein
MYYFFGAFMSLGNQNSPDDGLFYIIILSAYTQSTAVGLNSKYCFRKQAFVDGWPIQYDRFEGLF